MADVDPQLHIGQAAHVTESGALGPTSRIARAQAAVEISGEEVP